MSGIQIPIIQQSVGVGGVAAPRAEALPGNNYMGEALGKVGAAAAEVGTAMQKRSDEAELIKKREAAVLAHQEEQSGKIYAGNTTADAYASIGPNYEEFKSKMQPGEQTLVPFIQKSVKDYFEQASQNAPTPAAANFITQHGQTFLQSYTQKALADQAQANIAYRGNQFTQQTQTWANTVTTDPTKVDLALKTLDETMPALDPEVQIRMREAARVQILTAAAIGEVQRNPRGAYDQLSRSLGGTGNPNPAAAGAPGTSVPSASTALAPATGPDTRGERNNNFGNIRKSEIPWQGKIPGTDPEFETFSTPEAGVRATAKNLLSYSQDHGRQNVQSIISAWAPSSENNTGAYIAAVSKQLGVKPDEPLNLKDPKVLSDLTTAIIQHENGRVRVSAQQVKAGVDSALSGVTLAGQDEAGNQFLSQAESKYPFLKQHKMIVLMRPTENSRDFAETYVANDQAEDPNAPRPKEVPIDRHGVEIYKPGKFTVDDLAGEALHFDPKAVEVAKKFQASLSPEQMDRIGDTPDYKAPNIDEAHKNKAGVDSVLRGYVVGQWPKEALDEFGFSKEQKAMLDDLKGYMTKGGGQATATAPNAAPAPTGNPVFDKMTVAERYHFLDIAHTAAQQSNTAASAQFKAQVQDATAAARNGDVANLPKFTPAQWQQAYGPAYLGPMKDYEVAQQFGVDKKALATQTDAQISATLSARNPTGTPVDETYQSRLQNFTNLQTAAGQVIDARNKDGASWAMQNSPIVQQKYQAWSQLPITANDTQRAAAVRDYAVTTIGLQQSVGVKNPRLLAPSQVDDAAMQFNKQPNGPDGLVNYVQKQATQWGPYWPQYVQELGDKVPPAVQVLASGLPQSAAVMVAQTATLKLETIQEGMAKDVVDQVKKKTAEAFEPVRATLLLTDPHSGAKTLDAFYKSAEKSVSVLVAQGQSPSNAASRVFADYFGDKYNFVDTWRAPKQFDVDKVAASAQNAKEHIGDLALDLPPDAPAENRDMNLALFKNSVRSNSYWATSADERGLVLKMNGSTVTAGGKPIFYPFEDLQNTGRSFMDNYGLKPPGPSGTPGGVAVPTRSNTATTTTPSGAAIVFPKAGMGIKQ